VVGRLASSRRASGSSMAVARRSSGPAAGTRRACIVFALRAAMTQEGRNASGRRIWEEQLAEEGGRG
jgi:hypothetical protein